MFKKLSKVLLGVFLVSMLVVPVVSKNSISNLGNSYTTMGDWPTGTY
ncbi:hypothetical protein CSC2_25990 [Clostridium zeae]|uniref:Uncharacterized protein n=1 Tax=Clostridium zeae TaxID=2759022 RepID=A0ABQ1EC51_9CLOT|nr:hypothetical protein [Clostridium zeae]GFZ32073.1 hypothetical protein CSC2_25990 [Clostridium zeae]